MKQYEDLLKQKYEEMEFSELLNEEASFKIKDSLPDIQHSISKLYTDMYEYFGDRMIKCLQDFNEKFNLKQKVFTPKFKEKLISLSDADASKSGDELLKVWNLLGKLI